MSNGEIPLFSLVVFSERCELKKIQFESQNIKVIKRDRLYAAVRDICGSRPDVLTDEQISKLYEKLKLLTNADEAVKQAYN